MVKSQITHNALETQKIAADVVREILALKPQKSATILALKGNLGAGKTTFVQGFARALGIEEIVNSPTFVLMKRFKLNGPSFKNFYHIDCYRLDNEQDLESLGFKEIIADPENIVAIEWPEKISEMLPEHILEVEFQHKEGDERELTMRI